MYKDLLKLFLKLGFFAYGGPAAHISMMREEVVDKHAWFSDQEFLEMLSFTNLIPGPNSTEMAILIGYKKAGIIGLLIAGLSFIIPAVFIVLVLSAFYVRYHTVPQIQSIFNGMLPAILIIITLAILKLTQKSLKGIEMYLLFIVLTVLLVVGISEFVILLFGALYYIFRYRSNKIRAVEPFSFTILFMTFLKIGAVLYGSGYVLISFLQTELVQNLGWLTQSQLIDLVAIGEITPGPVFTTATAVGYFLGGLEGGLLATVGIFIPSFIFIGVLSPVYDKLKEMAWIQSVLKGLSVASLAIMLSVAIDLGITVSSNLSVMLIGVVMLASYQLFEMKSTYLILIGAVLGFILL